MHGSNPSPSPSPEPEPSPEPRARAPSPEPPSPKHRSVGAEIGAVAGLFQGFRRRERSGDSGRSNLSSSVSLFPRLGYLSVFFSPCGVLFRLSCSSLPLRIRPSFRFLFVRRPHRFSVSPSRRPQLGPQPILRPPLRGLILCLLSGPSLPAGVAVTLLGHVSRKKSVSLLRDSFSGRPLARVVPACFAWPPKTLLSPE